jgi:hypothetical protein
VRLAASATVTVFAVMLMTTDVPATTSQNHTIGDNWRTFTNRAGWSVRYPRNWRVTNCRECDDSAEPSAALALTNPFGDETIMIERLADKPEGKRVETWLHETAKDTVLSAIQHEEWITLNRRKALKVVNVGSENVYTVDGSLTIAIRYGHPVQAVTQIVSTFKFAHRK